MSEHHLASSSFGDPKAHPHTPRHTPTAATFPSPVFETPKHYQGSFAEPGGLTPRFAEEYSVFNSTPGNLRGSQGPFTDFLPASFSRSHKRLSSVEGPVVDIAAHASRTLSSFDGTLPPANPSHRRPSSPGPWASQTGPPAPSDTQPSPHLSRDTSTGKPSKDPNTALSGPTQVISPPPTSRKPARQLGLRLSMHHDQAFGQPDLSGSTQHDMAVLMGSSDDMFGYPMSAPATAPTNFWGSSVPMSMDLEFDAAGHHSMQAPTPPSHRHTGSFDWNADVQLFQDAVVPAHVNNQENFQQGRRERVLAPKPPAAEVVTACAGDTAAVALHSEDPFGMINPGDGVDPGLLFGRPQAALDLDYGTLPQSDPVEMNSVETAARVRSADLRRGNSSKVARNSRLPDRASASSPIRPSTRPGLGRSYSENRGRRAVGRKVLPLVTEIGRSAPPTNSGQGALSRRSGGRSSVRGSPSKAVPRLSNLESIPETSPQYRPRTSVRFTIDASGRARAETLVMGDGSPVSRSLHHSRSSGDVAGRGWDSSDDDSTDDEPIIIPSRCSSFNASFALPDPRKPVGSIFHTSCRDISNRSRSSSANGAESEAETVVHDRPNKGGDATSELRKVVEDRHKWSSRMGSVPSRRYVSTNASYFPGGIISPTSLTGSSHGPCGQNVRCVCQDTSSDEADGFMLQCEACEMWLHGKCVKMTRRSMPSVYICCFCANTQNTAGRGSRESGLGIGGLLSPLANKAFRSFR